MSDLLSRMITHYRLDDSTSTVKSTRIARTRRMCAAERQNWRCCYCCAPMFAGVPTEDLFAYARMMSIPLKRAGIWWPKSFEQIFGLKVTVEHLTKREYRGVLGSFINSEANVAAACYRCNFGRGDRSTLAWYEETQALLRTGKHPHSRFVTPLASPLQ